MNILGKIVKAVRGALTSQKQRRGCSDGRTLKLGRDYVRKEYADKVIVLGPSNGCTCGRCSAASLMYSYKDGEGNTVKANA